MALPRPIKHAEFAAKRCSYHLRAIRPRISCVTIRRRFILFYAAQFLLFVKSPLSTHAVQTTRRSPVRNRIFRAFPAPRPLMPSSRRPPARRSAVRKSTRQRPSSAAESWIKRTLAKMSLEEKLGQLVMLPFHGEFTSFEGAAYQELLRAIEQNHVGGFMLGTRAGPFGIERCKPYATAALINLLQKASRIPLLFDAGLTRGTHM